MTKKIKQLIERAERQIEEDGRLKDSTYLALNRASMKAYSEGNDDLGALLEDLTFNV